jgi:hypothetical protein
MCRHVYGKTESIEILLEVLDVRVAVIERAMCCKLLLKKDLQCRPNLGCDDLSAFSIEVPAESLKMGGE